MATFDRPMYRPDDAFGMMSVISAQSTARKIPADDAEQQRPDEGDGQRSGAAATIAEPDRAERAARPR